MASPSSFKARTAIRRSEGKSTIFGLNCSMFMTGACCHRHTPNANTFQGESRWESHRASLSFQIGFALELRESCLDVRPSLPNLLRRRTLRALSQQEAFGAVRFFPDLQLVPHTRFPSSSSSHRRTATGQDALAARSFDRTRIFDEAVHD